MEVLILGSSMVVEPRDVLLAEICGWFALAEALGVEWCRFDLVASGTGFSVHLVGDFDALCCIAASAPDGYTLSAVISQL
jgi:hypothetical protein